MRDLTRLYQEALSLGDMIRAQLLGPLRPESTEQVAAWVAARGALLAEAQERGAAAADRAAATAGLQALLEQQQELERLMESALTSLRSDLEEAGRSRSQVSESGRALRQQEPARYLDTRR